MYIHTYVTLPLLLCTAVPTYTVYIIYAGRSHCTASRRSLPYRSEDTFFALCLWACTPFLFVQVPILGYIQHTAVTYCSMIRVRNTPVLVKFAFTVLSGWCRHSVTSLRACRRPQYATACVLVHRYIYDVCCVAAYSKNRVVTIPGYLLIIYHESQTHTTNNT